MVGKKTAARGVCCSFTRLTSPSQREGGGARGTTLRAAENAAPWLAALPLPLPLPCLAITYEFAIVRGTVRQHLGLVVRRGRDEREDRARCTRKFIERDFTTTSHSCHNSEGIARKREIEVIGEEGSERRLKQRHAIILRP